MATCQVVDITEESNGTHEEFSFGNATVDDYCKRVMGLTRLCQKYSNELQGWHHYSDYKGVRLTMSKINYHLNSLIARIFSHQDIRIDLFGNKLTNQFEILREGNDALLEKVNTDLDEASGLRRNVDIEMLDSTVRTIRGPVIESSGRDIVLLASRNVQKPQLFFATKINNSSKEPFIPPLKDKPNSKKPLAIHLCQNEDGQEYYSHPYEYELQHWTPPEANLLKTSPVKPLFLPDTPFQLIENESQLLQMIDELQKSHELAVDLEAHQFRSYQGLTCLIQISTREKDYIVDPFPIRDKLSILNDVFTNSSITKVLHGADSDILWLQRDFGVYVVNLFDTHQAAVVLNYPHRSLATLLHKFCSINANKCYQRADWRIRPLPEDFMQYARQDSHYLLYIYDELRNELIEKGNELNNLIIAVYNRSTEICLKRYEKTIVDSDSYLNLYRRSRKCFNSRQLYALQHLFLWRDKVARDQDESVEYVLPKHMMLQIAEMLPKEMQGILACCNPIPTLIKTEQLTLHQIVRAAREHPLTDILINLDALNVPQNAEGLFGADDLIASSFISRHDLSMVEEKTLGMSTLMNPQETLLGDLFDEKHLDIKIKIKSSLLGIAKTYRNINMVMNILADEFKSPFERYKEYLEMKPLMEENLEKEKPENLDADAERVNKIHEHFLSLSRRTYNYSDVEVPAQSRHSEVSEAESDLDRIRRLQSHIADLVKEGINFDDQGTDDSSSSEGEKDKSIITYDKFADNAVLDTQMQEHFNILRTIRESVLGATVNIEKDSADLNRMNRLQNQHAGLTQEDMANCKNKNEVNISPDEDEINQHRKTNSKICMSEQIKAEFEARKSLKNNSTKANKNVKKNKSKALKRKSSESSDSSKKTKLEDMPIADLIPTESFDDSNEPKGGEDVAITPFDYEKADFNMFKNKKAEKLKSFKMKLKEKFKAKSSAKASGTKRSGLKSISWGTKK